MVSIDPELGEECHGEIDHLLRRGDKDGLALEAAKPVALPTVMPFDGMRRGFTLHQLVLWDDRRIGGPLVCAVHGDVPLRKAIDPLFECLLIPSSTFPVQELPGVPIESLPDPEFRMPHQHG